ncbi:mycothiol transferase [Streptomyces sp. NPDC001348]
MVRSPAHVRKAVAEGGAGQVAAYTNRSGELPLLRRPPTDMIEEYPRHLGHADLIRESVDGRVGEDPPAGL